MLRAELAGTVGDIELEVSLRVAAGRCLALAGPSGAGKTTILRLIAGTATPFAAGSSAASRCGWTPSAE